MTARAYRYHRYSTKGQDKGSSIERQDEATAAMCRERGWSVQETIEDRGRSAWKGDHLRVGNLGRFKQRVDSGEIESGSILVIENLDRLSRENVKKARRWIEEVTDAGVWVAVANKGKVYDSDSLSGDNLIDLLEYLLEVKRANEESARKSDFRRKVNANHIEMAKRGEIYTPRAPLWLVEVDGKWIERPERGAVVRQIYEWSASGLGYSSICQKLNAEYEPWRATDVARPEWRYGYIRDILRSPAIEGEYHRKVVDEDRDEVILGYYPRIVPADLVERARQAVKGRLRTGGPKAAESRNLFSGRVTCAYCKGPMAKTVNMNRHRRKYYYFVCRGVRNGTCDNRTQYRYDLFETGVLREILHLSLDNSNFVKVDQAGPLIVRVAELKKAIELRQAEIGALIRVVKAGSTSRTLAAELDAAESEVMKLEGELGEAEAALSRARGSVSPEEHLRRVMEVRDAMDSDDPETAEQARRMVRTAMQGVIKSATFGNQWTKEGKRERRIHLTLNGSHVFYWLDGEGNVVKQRDLLEMFERDPESIFSRMLINSADNPAQAQSAVVDQVRRKAKLA